MSSACPTVSTSIGMNSSPDPDPVPGIDTVRARGVRSRVSVSSNEIPASTLPDSDPIGIDHLVYACRDLEEGVQHVSGLLGTEPAAGGTHPDWGTHNALLGLGPRCYLEVIAPLPGSDPIEMGTPEVFFDHGTGRLTNWALRVPDLEEYMGRQGELQPPLGKLMRGSRRRTDGALLAWILTDPAQRLLEGTAPFLIDWLDSEHPARSMNATCRLRCLRLTHPRPDSLEAHLTALGARELVELGAGPRPEIRALIAGPRGMVEI